MVVDVAWSRIRKRLEQFGDALTLELRIPRYRGMTEDLRNAVASGVRRANASTEPADGEPLVRGDEVASDTPRGPVIRIESIDATEDADEETWVHRWVDVLARELEGAGVRGKLTVADVKWAPDTPWARRPAVCAATAFPISPDVHAWPRVPHEPYQRFVDLISSWGYFEGADIYASLGSPSVSTMTDLAGLRDLIEWPRPLRRVTFVSPDLRVERIIAYTDYHSATFLAHHPEFSPREQFDEVRRALLHQAPDLAYGCIFNRGTSGHLDIPGMNTHWAQPPIPPTLDHRWRLRGHLWDRYIPGVFGSQLLTAAHLDKVASLEDWQVTRVPGGRYLVEARDLEPWIADAMPPHDLVESAWAAFAPAIFTATAIEAEG